MTTVIDLTGQRFGWLTVVAREGTNQKGQATWRCKCACGDHTTAATSDLNAGNKKSCGCKQRLHYMRRKLSQHGTRGTRMSVDMRDDDA